METLSEASGSLARIDSNEVNAAKGVGRAKSSQRLRYEAEVEIVRKKLGSLEGIRMQLGLSQRKMAQLLFVDPSAWTRWTRGNSRPPPHIYRMLQWYLALNEKFPALDTSFWLQNVARTPASETDQLRERLGNLEYELAHLKAAQALTEPVGKKRGGKPALWVTLLAAVVGFFIALMLLKMTGL